MHLVTSGALALVYWLGYPFYENFGSRDLTWLLIGVVLAVLVMFVYSRRRRRWF